MHFEPHKEKGERKISFSDVPPSPGPEIFILRMPKERCLTFTAWGDKIFGIDIHWCGDRSAPHYEPAEQCESCMKRMPKKWRGYLHVYCSEMHQEVFLEFTPTTAISFREQVPNPTHLRGCVFQLKRGKSANAKMSIIICNPVSVTEALPKPKDPRSSVLKLYGFSFKDIAGEVPHEIEEGEKTDFA